MSARQKGSSDLRRELGALARELPAVASYIRQGRCALFVGAGLSASAGYPLWPALIDALIKRTVTELGTLTRPRMPKRGRSGVLMVPHYITDGIAEYEAEREQIRSTAQQLRRLAKAQRLLDVADQCRALLGPGRFALLLRELLPQNARPTEAHRSIVDTPYACVLTTNFDTLIEDAYTAWGRHGRPKAPTGIELANHGTLLLDRTFFVLKAHGTLEDSASLVFTSDDYRRISFATPAFEAMLSAIFLSYALLFVGYSLGDPNFRLLFDAQLTTFGTDVPPRYAIMAGLTEVERELLWRTARIRTIEYKEGHHELVPEILAYLAREAGSSDEPAQARSAAKRRSSALSRNATATRREVVPKEFRKALYVRIAARGIRLDVAWTDRASHAKAWRESDAGAETTVGPALLLPFSELQNSLLTAAWSGRRAVTRVGDLLAHVLPAPLISEIAALSRDRPVVLSLSPESEPLPWEWMLIEGTPLAERNPIVRAAVGVSDWSRGRACVAEPLQALVIGDPGSGYTGFKGVPFDFFKDVVSLPGSRREAEDIAALLHRKAGARVRLLLGADATYNTVMREVRTGDYDVIHFAGHAWFDERESYISLHDGRVWVSELGSLLHRRPPALMMINSHYTAFVPLFSRIQIPGEAPPKTIHDHLVRALARARGFTRFASRIGVAEFIACFGEPGDESAAQFAVDIYTALAKRRTTVADAVLRARRAVIDEADITRLLYTHSGYGDTRLRG